MPATSNMKKEGQHQMGGEKTHATTKTTPGKKSKETSSNSKSSRQASDKKLLEDAKSDHQPKMKDPSPEKGLKETAKRMEIAPKSGSGIPRKIFYSSNLENDAKAPENVQPFTAAEQNSSVEEKGTTMAVEN
ncbi:unnamed protein product [Linum trigynum]|uniref:Uncharacterized protein n=1 Tax=Linum trigynum TaxID=586398 RepID=A0AAV2ECI4_9ROSI